MIDIDTKQRVIADFCHFIENLPDAESLLPIESESTADLFTLCKEFIALKTEVKQESRQFKIALDSFKEVFNTLQQSHGILAKELAQRRQEQQLEIEKQQYTILKPLLLNLIELRDCLEMGVNHHKTYRPHFLIRRLIKREQAFIASMCEGQAMTLRRVDQLLANYEVRFLTTVQKPFDPQCMRAIGVEHRTDLPNGIVISEVRKGFIWKSELLRTAEVKVNKIEESDHA